MEFVKENPCSRCQKADGAVCDNKDCAQWRKWFEQRWDFMRGNLLGKWEAQE